MTSSFQYPFELTVGSETYPAKFILGEDGGPLDVEVDGVRFAYAVEGRQRFCIMGNTDEQRRVADQIRAYLKITSEASALFFDVNPPDAYEQAVRMAHQHS